MIIKNCIVVTPYIHSEWIGSFYQEAINNPKIARFLSMSPYISIPQSNQSTWEVAYLMHTSRKGLVVLSLDRGSNCAALACWVLPSAGIQQQLIAGRLLHYAVTYAKSNLSMRYISWDVHSTNLSSLAISRRSNVGGTEIEIIEEDAYDSYLGKSVARHHFKRKL